MNCKYCGAELEDGALLCPECSKAQDAPEAVACADEPEMDEEFAQEAQTPEASFEEEPKKHNTTSLIAAIAGLGVLLLVLLAFVIPSLLGNGFLDFSGLGAKVKQLAGGTQQTAAQPAGQTAVAGSHYVPETALTDADLETVVATCGEDSLTNRAFALYYWDQYRYFANYYSAYLPYMLDTTKGLDEQQYDEQTTWQQMFMTAAADMFRSVSAIAQEAEKNGFELDDLRRQSIANLAEGLEQTAVQNGYENAADYLAQLYGTGCTVEGYTEYIRKNQLAQAYLNELTEQKSYTAEEISAYYDENAEHYAQSGVLKIDKPNISVRHVLIQPEEKDADGNYTDAAWAAAEKTMNDILAEFENGAHTEERFAELAQTYSQDPGSAQNGGLYENVHPGQMVEAFNDWCFADGRKSGDYGIVKTNYGYHLMYFVAQSDTVYWYETAKEDLLVEYSKELEAEIAAKYEFRYEPENVKLQDILKQNAG